MEDCCTVDRPSGPAPETCPRCGQVGRVVDRVTVKALLRPHRLTRLSDPEHRFCSASHCPVVYFGGQDVFERGDVTVPVFQKEAPGGRVVCYCFGITEADIRGEIAAAGRSTAADQITTLVKADRCACEVKNPQGRCCLGNVAEVTAALEKEVRPASPSSERRPDRNPAGGRS